MKAVTYGMGALIVVLTLVLLGELGRRAFMTAEDGAATARVPIALAAGERIAGLSGGDRRTVLLLERADGGQRLVVLNHDDGSVTDWPLTP